MNYLCFRQACSSHLTAGSKIEPDGGAISRRMIGIDERLLTVIIFFLVSRSKVYQTNEKW